MWAEHDVVAHRQGAEHRQVLEGAAHAQLGDLVGGRAGDRLPFEQDVTGLVVVEPGQAVEQGGLARAVGADQAAHMAAVHVEAHAVECHDAAESNRHPTPAEQGACCICHRCPVLLLQQKIEVAGARPAKLRVYRWRGLVAATGACPDTRATTRCRPLSVQKGGFMCDDGCPPDCRVKVSPFSAPPRRFGACMSNIYEQHLDRRAANFVALSPVSFVERSAEEFGDPPSVVHGQRRYTWAHTRERSARLAAALRALGVGRGSTVSVMLPNTPEMVEAHYAVPALNAVLNTLNTRLDAPLLAWQMNHCEAQVVITDREFAAVMGPALVMLREQFGRQPVVIDVDDSEYTGPGDLLGGHVYETLMAAHAPLATLDGPDDEWDAIAVSYTSGTTGDPKGVVTNHRGAYLNAVCNAATWTMPNFPSYLWTLPMFHCNGWCFPWTVAMLGGTHV